MLAGLRQITDRIEVQLVGSDQKPSEDADDVGDEHEKGQGQQSGYEPRQLEGGMIAYAAMAAMQVMALVEDRAKVEIQATAVVPD